MLNFHYMGLLSLYFKSIHKSVKTLLNVLLDERFCALPQYSQRIDATVQ